MASPAVSVVIPIYNRAGLIGETLVNVLGQSLPPHEVIVIDDGSTDASAEVVAGFGDRVRLIRQNNRGPGAARNRGLAEASGELIQLMDSDDLWSLNKLEAQGRVLAQSGADFAYSPWLQARLEDGRALHAEPVLQQRPLPASRPPLAWFVRGWVTVFQCCLFRRSLLDRVGPYREDLMPSEDSELLFRILAHGARPVHAPEALVLYRLHGGSQISRGGMADEKRARDWERFVGVVAGQLDGVAGLSASDRRRWRWTEWEAARAVASLGLEPAREIALSPASQAARRWDRGARRTAAGLARRSGGSSFAQAYAPGPLSAAQKAQLREIGYVPQRVPHAALDGA